MSNHPKLCILGDVVIDVSLNLDQPENKLRFGGIVHAARGLWALGEEYGIAYFGPEYFDKDLVKYVTHHNCIFKKKIGNVIGSPYIFFINEVKEVGNQGYDFILRDEIEIHSNEQSLKELSEIKFQDILIISGNYSITEVIPNINLGTNLHIDLANNIDSVDFLKNLQRKFKTIFISTSSTIFQKEYRGDFTTFAKIFEPYTENLILKENRGGTRAINFADSKVYHIASQTKPIVHSVGVGDSFDACFVSNYGTYSFEDSLVYASWVAAEYASTTFPDDFANAVKRIMNSKAEDLRLMGGVSLPWEKRQDVNIYIAAPDFDFINTIQIDKLCESLTYHNFIPRRPIKENGQMEKDAPKSRKQELYLKDMELLSKCNMLVAVLLNNDPGTLIEIGIASEKGMPTIVYDPFNQAKNCMLTQRPDFISNDMDEIISEIFTFAAKII